MYVCDKKLWRTERGKIVLDGDVRARVLIATPGDELQEKPVIEKFEAPPKADHSGWAYPHAPEKGTKARGKGEDKSLEPDEDKGAGKLPGMEE